MCTPVLQITIWRPSNQILKNQTGKRVLSIFVGSEGVDEIKRHLFFANIDWNVSRVESVLLNTFKKSKNSRVNGNMWTLLINLIHLFHI